jgi:hypothetical protein
MSQEKLYGPFFFIESTVTGFTYLDMLREWLMSQLQENIPDLIYQQDGAPTHFHNEVRSYLDECLRNFQIGCGGPMEWRLKSPDLRLMDFLLWGFVKDNVCVSLLLTTLHELKTRIREVCANTDQEILHNVW